MKPMQYYKNTSHKINLIIGLSLIFLILYLYAYYLAQKNINGYCFAEKRYLSQQEKIDRMIAYVLKKEIPEMLPAYGYKNQQTNQLELTVLRRKPTEKDPNMQKPMNYSMYGGFSEDYFEEIDAYEGRLKGFAQTIVEKHYVQPQVFGFKPYQNVEDFKKENPNCCYLTEEGAINEAALTKADKIAGVKRILINMLIKYNQQTNNAPYLINYEMAYDMTNCGKNPKDGDTVLSYYEYGESYISVFSIFDFLTQDF